MSDEVDTRIPPSIDPAVVDGLALPDADVRFLRSELGLMRERLAKVLDAAANAAKDTLGLAPELRRAALGRILDDARAKNDEAAKGVAKDLDALEAEWTTTLERAVWGDVTPMPAAVVAELRGMLRAMPSAVDRANFIGDAIERRDARVLRAIFDSNVPACLLGLEPKAYDELRARCLSTADPTRGGRAEALRLARVRFNAACSAFLQEIDKLAPR